MVVIKNPAVDTHKANITPVERRIVVKRDDLVLADSANAVSLAEENSHGAYPAALYFPKADVSDALLPVEGKSTHCPLKGDASYFSLNGDEIAWTYDRPLPSAKLLADYVAFYANKVTIVDG